MRTNDFLLLPCLITGLLVAASADAGGCMSSDSSVGIVKHIFDRADQDQDGVLTPAEYEEAGLQSYGVTFEQSDTDADGTTSLDEYIELYQKHHPTSEEGSAV